MQKVPEDALEHPKLFLKTPETCLEILKPARRSVSPQATRHWPLAEPTAAVKDEAQTLVSLLKNVLQAIWDRDQCADRRMISLEECRATLLGLATVLLSDVVAADSWTGLTLLLQNFLGVAMPPGSGSGKPLDVQQSGSVVAALGRALLARVGEAAQLGTTKADESEAATEAAASARTTTAPMNASALEQHATAAPAIDLRELLAHTKLESLQQILSRVETEHARHVQHASCTTDVTAATPPTTTTTTTEPTKITTRVPVAPKATMADQQLQKQLLLEHTLAQERANAALAQQRKQHELLMKLQEMKAARALRRYIWLFASASM